MQELPYVSKGKSNRIIDDFDEDFLAVEMQTNREKGEEFENLINQNTITHTGLDFDNSSVQ